MEKGQSQDCPFFVIEREGCLLSSKTPVCLSFRKAACVFVPSLRGGVRTLSFSAKNRQVSACRIFLSKPQAWYIITMSSLISLRPRQKHIFAFASATFCFIIEEGLTFPSLSCKPEVHSLKGYTRSSPFYGLCYFNSMTLSPTR